MTNFCAGLFMNDQCVLTLALQARLTPDFLPGQSATRDARTRFQASGSSSITFRHAVVLARLILHDLEATVRAGMAVGEFDGAPRRLDRSQPASMLRREKPEHPLTAPSPCPVKADTTTRAGQLVAVMEDYVRQHYHHPVSLGELASAMKMNASYLSALFSESTGVPFHRFLQEFRLSRARELLRDPRNLVSEVACATGYSSPDAFRHAFKAHEGFSPEAWRSRR
jgi:AraC-like DNA-binding protein